MAIIYTHCDFDGLISAVLLNFIFPYHEVEFVTPTYLLSKSVTKDDIIADLPYISGCGLWFDHHKTNYNELLDRNIDVKSIKGFWKEEKSAAQVIYRFYKDRLPQNSKLLVDAADEIDSMDYKTIEDWLEAKPQKIINDSITLKNQKYSEFNDYLHFLYETLQKVSLEKLSELKEVRERYNYSVKQNEKDKEYLKKIIKFIGSKNKIIVIDYTNLSLPPRIEKNIAVQLYPEIEVIIALSYQQIRRRNTNNVKISVGKNFLRQNEFSKDIGNFFAKINIGGGHRNAAGAILYADSKKERLTNVKNFLDDFVEFWEN